MKNNSKNIIVTKASGETAVFSEEKLENSLLRAGATKEDAATIIVAVKQSLYPEISTKKIYQLAFKLLQKRERHFAARYNLKKAIMQLGPSGFPFEKFIGELLSNQGYSIRLNQFLEGKCVTHEIDVIAEKENHFCIIECKYHNSPGIFCTIKVPLYINSRVIDVTEILLKEKRDVPKIYEGWVVTNTKFSYDSVKYGNCAGLKLLGWDYPVKNGLKDMIDRLKLYPITCLTSLTQREKIMLLESKIILCKELFGQEQKLSEINISPARTNTILEECSRLTN